MNTKEKSQPKETQAYRLDDQIGFLLRQVNQRHTALFARKLGPDLTPTQWATLAKLHETGPVSQNNLGRATAMDVATIKGVVDRLKERGLIGRTTDAADGRRRLVALTSEGRAFVEARMGQALAVSDETLRPLTVNERTALLALLRKMK